MFCEFFPGSVLFYAEADCLQLNIVLSVSDAAKALITLHGQKLLGLEYGSNIGALIITYNYYSGVPSYKYSIMAQSPILIIVPPPPPPHPAPQTTRNAEHRFPESSIPLN